MNKLRVPFFLFVAILVPSLTMLIIKLAKGYSFDFRKKQFEPGGILVATSIPDGAQVFLNGELKTATDNPLSLLPGSYQIEIKKEGFLPWSKKILIEKELVTKTDAFLFKATPDLRPITFLGAENPALSPDADKIVYSSSATESGKAGLWLADLNEFPFGISRSPKQIVQSKAKGKDFSQAQIFWSPDARQTLISLNNQNFLIDLNQLTLEQNLIDISWNIKSIKESWADEEKKISQAKLKRLPKELQTIIATSAADLKFSPDGEKLLFLATASAQIPENLISPLPASSTQKEEREIKPGRIYVYDLKEDKNFFITETNPSRDTRGTRDSLDTSLFWFPTSRHLLWLEPEKISLIEYDGTNKTTIYTGPFENSFVFPAPGGNKIIILTSFDQEENQIPNLYSINLR